MKLDLEQVMIKMMMMMSIKSMTMTMTVPSIILNCEEPNLSLSFLTTHRGSSAFSIHSASHRFSFGMTVNV